MAVSPDRDAVLDALRVVNDPDLRRDIVSLGFIKDLSIKDGHVSFAIELTTPACPVKTSCASRRPPPSARCRASRPSTSA